VIPPADDRAARLVAEITRSFIQSWPAVDDVLSLRALELRAPGDLSRRHVERSAYMQLRDVAIYELLAIVRHAARDPDVAADLWRREVAPLWEAQGHAFGIVVLRGRDEDAE
jgi:hypothetical protein